MSKHNQNIRGKLFKYFKQRLNIKLSTKGWYRSDCPYCAGNYCFGVNLLKNKAQCFKCGERHSLIETLMGMENFSTLNEAKNFINIQAEYDGYEDAVVRDRLEKKDVNLPESFKLILYPEGLLGKAAQRYVKKRGFKLTELAMRGVGYCLDGEYAGYIIFPFYRKTELVFFQGRKFMGGGPKMKNPSNEEFGVGKTEIVYNQDALFLYDHINVVESITNAITLGDNTIALLGKHISSYQLMQIMKSPCTHITILLDDDALDEACNLAMQLCHYKKIRLIKMPEKKDVNDLGKTETRKLMKQTEYQNYNYFFKLRQEINAVTINPYIRGYSSYSSSRGAS